MNDVLFTKEDSTILKGIAICLMVYYHVAACGNMIHNSLLMKIQKMRIYRYGGGKDSTKECVKRSNIDKFSQTYGPDGCINTSLN